MLDSLRDATKLVIFICGCECYVIDAVFVDPLASYCTPGVIVDGDTLIADGTVQARYIYDAYGVPTVLEGDWTSDTPDDKDNELRYCSYYPKLQYSRARYYVPRYHGRWLSRDPIGYVDSMNLYEYVGKNYAQIKGKSIVTKAYSADVQTISDDYLYSIGEWRSWATATDIKCVNGEYSMKWTIHLRDLYDWDINGNLGAGELPFCGAVLWDSDLAKMHRYGARQEFEVFGKRTIEIKWKKGDRKKVGAILKGGRRDR